jgi:MoaA/NifB/PqqE/SkfB family radical SAM enzyme
LKNTVEKLIRNRAAEITSGFIAEGPDKLRRIADYFAALCGESEHVAPRCNVPWISAVIEADGSVRPCFFHRCFANLNDTSLKGALNSEELVHFRKTLSVADDPICRRCVCSLYLPSERFPKPSRGARGNRASCRA